MVANFQSCGNISLDVDLCLSEATITKRMPQTFIKEDADSEAERDDRAGIDHQEDEDDGRVRFTNHCSFISVDAQEESHDCHGDEEEQEILDKPGRPMQPVVETHHFH